MDKTVCNMDTTNNSHPPPEQKNPNSMNVSKHIGRGSIVWGSQSQGYTQMRMPSLYS